jgi:hypothetical protein
MDHWRLPDMRGASCLLLGLFVVTGAAEAQAQGACFFFQPNFQGEPMCIAPMQRIASLPGVARNKILSAQIPNGLRVTVCDGDNLSGTCMSLTQPVPDFTAIGLAGRVASIASDTAGPRAGAPQIAPQPPGPPPQQGGGLSQPPRQQSGFPPRSPAPPVQQGVYRPVPQQSGSVPPQSQGSAQPQQPLPQQQGSFHPQPQPGSLQPPAQQGPQQQPGSQPQQQGGYQPAGGNQPPPGGQSDANREKQRQLRRECRNGDTNACTELGRMVSQRRPPGGGSRD